VGFEVCFAKVGQEGVFGDKLGKRSRNSIEEEAGLKRICKVDEKGSSISR